MVVLYLDFSDFEGLMQTTSDILQTFSLRISVGIEYGRPL